MDILDNLVADGRATPQPFSYYSRACAASVNLETLHDQLLAWTKKVYANEFNLMARYRGSLTEITTRIEDGIQAMLDVLMGELYNRLRSVLEYFDPNARLIHMNPRAPLPARLEFPRFLATLCTGIGPLRIQQNFEDTLLVYITQRTLANNYGRAGPIVFNMPRYHELMDNLKAIGVPVANVDQQNLNGSFFTTCNVDYDNGVYDVTGSFASHYYTREDAVTALMFGRFGTDRNPFEHVMVSLDFVDDKDTCDALAKVHPATVDTSIRADGPQRLVGGLYALNAYGFTPAVAQSSTTPAVKRGIYVLGRGQDYKMLTSLMRNVTFPEAYALLRHRLLKA